MRALPAGGDSNLYTPSPVVSVTVARAGATASFRNAIIGGCLFGAALGSAFALTYFGAPSRAVSQARAELDTVAVASVSQNSVVASLSPAMPVATSERARALEPLPEREPSSGPEATRTVSSPAPHGPATHSTAPIARATRTPTTATVSAKAVAGDSGSNLINGGKLIYGD